METGIPAILLTTGEAYVLLSLEEWLVLILKISKKFSLVFVFFLFGLKFYLVEIKLFYEKYLFLF